MAIAKRDGNWRERRFTVIEGDSRTAQAHKDSSDVNVIVRRYQQTGDLPPNPRGLEPQYMDCTPFQQEMTEAYNDAKERQRDIEEEIEEKRRQALEDAKRPVDRDPETSPTDKPKADSQPAESDPKGAHSSE